MLIRKPKYFDEFKCLAGECPKTCCAGWVVVVDDNTCEKYNAMEGALGERIRSEMKEDDGDIIFQLRNGCCPFLNDENLCDIQAMTDEATLCRTCRMFPRFEHEFGLTREMGLSLSCPEAARLIMSAEKYGEVAGECVECVNAKSGVGEDTEFIEEQTDEGITQHNEIDPELYIELTACRKKLFEKLRDGEISLLRKIDEILKVAGGKVNLEILAERCLEICGKLECIDDGWTQTCDELLSLRGNIGQVLEFVYSDEEKRELESILFYYVYRYFLSAVLDERNVDDTEEPECSEENNDVVKAIEEIEGFNSNTVGKLLISVFCFCIIVSVYVIKQPKTVAERMTLVCDISREVEHSQINLDIVEEEMAKAIKEC